MNGNSNLKESAICVEIRVAKASKTTLRLVCSFEVNVPLAVLMTKWTSLTLQAGLLQVDAPLGTFNKQFRDDP